MHSPLTNIAALLFLLITAFPGLANHSEDADFDIRHYAINLQPNFNQNSLSGYTTVTFVSRKDDFKQVPLDLLSFNVDSVVSNGQQLSFNYNDTALTIDLNQTLSKTDTAAITIHYKGNPPTDPSGWGGFYFRNNVAFNLGVGFQAKPHNYGRAWFPCKDNFTDRALYDFHITTKPGKKAFCNGRLQSVDTLGNGKLVWHWSMDQTLPTYLASMAVGPYATVKEMYQGINGRFPILYAVKPEDSSRLKKGFQNMPDALEAFEEFYGPHAFSRVGYVSVPFAGGAMEHATNIAFPSGSLGKSISNERLWAHELSHHWWGDLVTCHDAEEMWLNEGWASFSEFLYLENAYGQQAYTEAVRDNHFNVLTQAHKDDNAYRPLVPVPHSVTYGTHSYDKGADVVHTLRSYLGDKQFKKGVNRFLQENAFEAVSSAELRDSLTSYTGQDLTNFFDNWVFNPGFPHFAITNLETNRNGNLTTIDGTIQQKIHQAPSLYTGVPLTISAVDNNWDTMNYKVMASGKETDFSFRVNFEPQMVALDMGSKISDAKTTTINKVTKAESFNLNRALMKIDVKNLQDSALMLVEHSWVQPDPYSGSNPGIRLSDARYWTVKGDFSDSFRAEAELNYNKREDPDSLSLDNTDSFRLMYRPNTRQDWKVYPDYSRNFILDNGIITIDQLIPGQYCFAKKDEEASGLSPDTKQGNKALDIYPNPARNALTIKYDPASKPIKAITIYSINGQEVMHSETESANPLSISTQSLDSGQYVLEAHFSNGDRKRQQFILED